MADYFIKIDADPKTLLERLIAELTAREAPIGGVHVAGPWLGLRPAWIRGVFRVVVGAPFLQVAAMAHANAGPGQLGFTAQVLQRGASVTPYGSMGELLTLGTEYATEDEAMKAADAYLSGETAPPNAPVWLLCPGQSELELPF